MEIIQDKDFVYENTCVTIGKFDGIHIGHRKIIDKVVELSRKSGYLSTVLTFDFEYFESDNESRLNSKEEKRRLLEECGIELLIDYPFDDETRNMSPLQFAQHVLKEKLDIRAIVVGDNFRFGKGASGNVYTLMELGKKLKFEVYPMKTVEYDGSIVSSTRIREEIRAGHLKEAHDMLKDSLKS